MKTQFLFVVVLCAVVEGQNYAYQGKSAYVPLIKDGVPVDTPEVQAAKAAHFEAYERARALAAKSPSNGQYEEYVPQSQQRYQQQQFQQRYQQQQFQQQPYQQSYQQPASYYQQQTYQQQPVYQQQQYQSNVIYTQPKQQQYAIGAYSSEIPVDTPEVQQARAAHLAALSQAQNHHYRIRRDIYESHHQVPEETPEVQVARYQHLVAHATAHHEDDDDYYEAPHTDNEYYHIPILTKKGVPVNTAAVKAARQQHLLAHKLEKAGIRQEGGLSHHTPVISANGVPFDTPEVHVAKVEHFAAHAKESYTGYEGGYHF